MKESEKDNRFIFRGSNRRTRVPKQVKRITFPVFIIKILFHPGDLVLKGCAPEGTGYAPEVTGYAPEGTPNTINNTVTLPVIE